MTDFSIRNFGSSEQYDFSSVNGWNQYISDLTNGSVSGSDKAWKSSPQVGSVDVSGREQSVVSIQVRSLGGGQLSFAPGNLHVYNRDENWNKSVKSYPIGGMGSEFTEYVQYGGSVDVPYYWGKCTILQHRVWSFWWVFSWY